MSDTTIVPVSMPRRLAAITDARARRLAMTRSEYIRTLVRREAAEETSDERIVQMLENAKRELKRGSTRTLKPGGLAAMIRT